MNVFSSALGLMKYGITEFFQIFQNLLDNITGVGLTVILSLLSVSLVWRYIISPFFK